MQRANAWSQLVIVAAIEVHRIKGPGLIEEIYGKCLGRECELRNIPFTKEVRVPLEYKGFVFEQPLRLDFLIDEVLILELKAVEEVLPIHKAQLLSYMKLLKKPLGLLINFHELILRNGICRMILDENAHLCPSVRIPFWSDGRKIFAHKIPKSAKDLGPRESRF
jgi:GxxExxY protein